MLSVIELYFWGIFSGGITLIVIFACLFYTKCVKPEIDQWIEEQLQGQNERPVPTISAPMPVQSFPVFSGNQPPQPPPPPPGSILTSIKTQNSTCPAFSYSGPLQKLSVADRDILYTSLKREKSTLPDDGIELHEVNLAQVDPFNDPLNESFERTDSSYKGMEGEAVEDEDDVIRAGDSAVSEAASFLPVKPPRIMTNYDPGASVLDNSFTVEGSCFPSRPWSTMRGRKHQAMLPQAPASLIERYRSTAGQNYFGSSSMRLPLPHHIRSSFNTKQAFVPVTKDFTFQSYHYGRAPPALPSIPPPVTLNPHYSVPVISPSVPVPNLEENIAEVSFYSGQAVPKNAHETSKGSQKDHIPRNFHYNETVYASIRNSRLKRNDNVCRVQDKQIRTENSFPVSASHHPYQASELSDISAILPSPPSVQQSSSACVTASEFSSGGNTSVEVHKHDSTDASSGNFPRVLCDCPENPFSNLSTSLVCSSYKETTDIFAMEPSSLRRSNSSGLHSHANSVENLELLEASLNVSCDTGIQETIMEINSMSLKRVKEKKLIYRPGLLPFNSLSQLNSIQTTENDKDGLSPKNDGVEITKIPCC